MVRGMIRRDIGHDTAHMTDGLKDVHREPIIAGIAVNDLVEWAVLFGSRALETNTRSSDLDDALFDRRPTLIDQTRLGAG